MPILHHAVGLTKSARHGADKHGAKINSGDDSSVCDPPARSCDHHAGQRGIKNVLHLGIGWQKFFQNDKYAMEFARIGSE